MKLIYVLAAVIMALYYLVTWQGRPERAEFTPNMG